MPSQIRIAPSILSADLARLADEIAIIETGGADWVHVDVMDGRFVPNITVGPPVIRCIRRVTTLTLDVHLMIVEAERYIGAFAEAGADAISVPVEGTVHLQRTLAAIRAAGKRAGAVLNPHTPEDSLRYVIDDLDVILVMSVNPGFGGQAFLPSVLPKIAAVRRMIDAANPAIDLVVDGGVDPHTAPAIVAAGARVLVAGSAVFGQPDRAAAIDALRRSVAAAT